MNIIVNGENRNIINVNLTFALDELGYKKMKLATALNGEFVSVQARDNINLKEGDKLEVIGEEDTLQPDVFGLVEAAKILSEEGFEVFPYTTEDLVVADKLLNSGCKVLMPWGSPIGSGQGLNNIFGLKALRSHFPDVPMIIDAGIGLPSHATKAMELGFDAVLLNTAIAKAGDPVIMAEAFSHAIISGALGRTADPMEPRDMANPSTPIFGKAFL